jgi:hypothetical protein
MAEPRVPRAARETLLAQLFEDVDTLLRRVEDLPAAMDAAGSRLDGATRSLDRRCDQLLALTTSLQNATREDLSALLRRRAEEAASSAAARAADEIRSEVRAALTEALRDHSNGLAADLKASSAREQRRWRIALGITVASVTASIGSAMWAYLAH